MGVKELKNTSTYEFNEFENDLPAEFCKMKILVTGGAGRVGSELVKELQKRNADVRVLIRKADTPTPKKVEVAIGDLLDPISVRKALQEVDKMYLLNAVLPDEL